MQKATMGAFRLDDTRILVKCYGSTMELKNNFEELISRKFVPLNFGGHLLKFSVDKIRGMDKYQKLLKHHSQYEIITWEAITPEIVEESRRIHFDQLCRNERLDREYSQFLVKDGKIMAVMIVIRLSDNCLSIVHMSMEEELPFGQIWIEMLAAFFRKTEKEFTKGGELLIQTGLDKGHKGILAICGEPDTDLYIHEYGITTMDEEETDALLSTLPDEVTYREEDCIKDFLNGKEAFWPTIQAFDRIPFAADLRKLPQNLLLEYFEEYKIWFERWEMEKSVERIKTILFECGHTVEDPNVARIYGCRSKIGKEMLYAYKTYGTLPELEHRRITLDEVCFFKVAERSDELHDVLPEQFRNIYDIQKFVIIGASIDDGELIGFAMLNRLPLSEDTSNLEFVYVLPEYRGIGIGEKLIRYVMSEAVREGSRQMLVKNIGRKQSGHGIGTYLERICKIKKRANGNIIEYSMEDFRNSTFYQTIMPKRKSLPKTIFINNMNDIRLKRFCAWSREDGYCFEAGLLDRFYCSFHEDEEENEITAMMEVSQVSTKGIYIRDIYIDDDYSTKLIAPALLAATLAHVDQKMPKDTMVIFQVFDEKFYNAFEELFGSCCQDFYRSEFLIDVTEHEPLDELAENNRIDIKRMFSEKLSQTDWIEKVDVEERMLVAMSLNPHSRIPGHEMSKYIYQSKHPDYVKGEPKLHYEIVEDEQLIREQFKTAHEGDGETYLLKARKKGINIVSLLICEDQKKEKLQVEDVYVDERFRGLGYVAVAVKQAEEAVGVGRLFVNPKLLDA